MNNKYILWIYSALTLTSFAVPVPDKTAITRMHTLVRSVVSVHMIGSNFKKFVFNVVFGSVLLFMAEGEHVQSWKVWLPLHYLEQRNK